jgi:hypothetical protein
MAGNVVIRPVGNDERAAWEPLSNSVAPTARLAPDAFSQVLPQNRNRVHLQSAKDQRPDGFSGVVLIEAYSPIRKLYEAGEKTQNL